MENCDGNLSHRIRNLRSVSNSSIQEHVSKSIFWLFRELTVSQFKISCVAKLNWISSTSQNWDRDLESRPCRVRRRRRDFNNSFYMFFSVKILRTHVDVVLRYLTTLLFQNYVSLLLKELVNCEWDVPIARNIINNATEVSRFSSVYSSSSLH